MRVVNIETFRLGVRNLWLHKLRSLLTVLGIIFGVAAVICMLSVSEGASADELRTIQLLGTRNILVNAVVPQQNSQASQGSSSLLEYGIKPADVQLLTATIPHLSSITTMRTVSDQVRCRDRRATATVTGVDPTFFQAVNIDIAFGRTLSDQDLMENRAVCVIGDDVRRDLFAHQDPIGQVVLATRFPTAVPFEVVGVLKNVQTAGAPQRGVEERNLNREVLVPFSAANKLFGEITVKRRTGSREMTKVLISGLIIQVDDLAHVLSVSEMVKRVLERNHSVQDYEVKVPLARLMIAEKKKRNNQMVLGFIAGISLLVGGIGIMNIMLATVTERTREIGVRRALGARRRHITVQFLVETIVLSTGGGLVGVALGWLGSSILSRYAEWQPVIQPQYMLLSFGLSMLVGLVSGMYPAIQAARLDPIEALRHE
ncbi:MAG: ABC transporter permease [Phycisphaerales bacterium]|nr:ABC transporter permease [Phycisphaerales bacterium]